MKKQYDAPKLWSIVLGASDILVESWAESSNGVTSEGDGGFFNYGDYFG